MSREKIELRGKKTEDMSNTPLSKDGFQHTTAQIIRRFISYYGPHRRLFYIDTLCALLVSLVDLAFPIILRWTTLDVFPYSENLQDGLYEFIFIIAVVLIAMFAVRSIAQHFIAAWGHIMGARMESNMRTDLFNQYERFSFSYYDRTNTGEMMSKLVGDLFDISEVAHHGPEYIFLCALKIVGSFGLLAFIEWRLALVLLAITTVMFLITLRQNIKMKRAFRDNREKIADVNAQLQDSLAGIRVMKSFANERVEREKFAHSNSVYLQSKSNQYMMMGSYMAFNSAMFGVLRVTVIVVGGIMVANHMMRGADLAIFALYISLLLEPIYTLVNFTETFQKGLAGFRRFIEVLETKPEILDKPNAPALNLTHGSVRFDNVSFGYEEGLSILQNFSLDIPAGKTVALVGVSGGGKTTICSLLPRFYDVNEGSITIDGQDIREVTQQSVREQIGLVQQDVYLFNTTIGQNIAYGKPDATFEEIVAAAKAANIHHVITELPNGYDTMVGERGTRLSGGQKQRISIARVFLKNPKILILDEATSALDNESERIVQESLYKLAEGRTVLVIAHRLSTVQHADEIVVIEGGKIVERGTHQDLLARDGAYARYHSLQFT